MEQGKDEKMNKKRANFTGTIGFVMAAAGSAVGLGNIWRFPYLAAKDHGGVFILCYLILAVTFGFTLLTTEIAIGRKTGRSPLTAYAAIQPKWKGLGVLAPPFARRIFHCFRPALPAFFGFWVKSGSIQHYNGRDLNRPCV